MSRSLVAVVRTVDIAAPEGAISPNRRSSTPSASTAASPLGQRADERRHRASETHDHVCDGNHNREELDS